MIKKLIARLTKPKGLFFDGSLWLLESNKPDGNYVYEGSFWNWDIQEVRKYPHRYLAYRQNKLGWWVTDGDEVYSTSVIAEVVS